MLAVNTIHITHVENMRENSKYMKPVLVIRNIMES